MFNYKDKFSASMQSIYFSSTVVRIAHRSTLARLYVQYLLDYLGMPAEAVELVTF